jgi:excinuclease UvrABC nuclease subunit
MIRLQFDNTYTIPVERIQISHCRSAEALMEHIQRNRDWLTQQKGIYIISAFDTNDTGTPRPIYIGKAKNLYKRLYEHCKEMMPERCSKIKIKKDKKWIDAFSPYRRHELIVEFIELEQEVDRRWLESKLHHKYDTIFEHKKV